MPLFMTDQQFDGSSLLPLWEALDEWERRMVLADKWFKGSVDITDRRLDANHRAGTRTYITASALIGIAREHQQVLSATMTGEHSIGVFPHATLNLVRPAFEAAMTAYWLLEPDDRKARLTRGLRQAWEDHRQAKNWEGVLFESTSFPEGVQEEREEKRTELGHRFREDAQELDVAWKHVTQKPEFLQEIKGLRAVRSDEAVKQAVLLAWRQLSGVQHGLMYASLRSNDRLGEVKIPGGYEVTLVTDDEYLTLACQVSGLAQVWAMSTYIERTRRFTKG